MAFALLLFASPTAILCVGCNRGLGAGRNSPTQTRHRLTLDDYVAQAKASGTTTISIPAPVSMRRAIGTYDDEMKYSHSFAVTAIASASGASPDKFWVNTFYKFSLNEDLSPKPYSSEATKDPPSGDPDVPRPLLPIGSNEIVVREVGGEVVLDGVLIRFGDWRRIFEPGKSYFIVVSPMGTSSRIFALAGSRETSFSISSDGDTLVPLDSRPLSPIQGDIAGRFHNSLGAIRADKAVAKR